MNGPFSNDVIHSALMRVEDECAVEQWRVGELRVWPLVKVVISADARMTDSELFGLRRLTNGFPVGPMIQIARTRSSYVASTIRDPDSQGGLRRAAVLMYGDGVSYVKADGRYFDRLLDPLALLLQRRGLSSCFATPSSGFQSPRTSPTYYVQPRLDRARVRARFRAAIRRPAIDGPDVDRALEMLRTDLPGAPIRDAHFYAGLAVYLESYQEEFARILNVVQPSMVFVVSYYGPEVMGLIREANRRGIIAVDVQHGLINAKHPAYSGSKPAAGFDVLPHAFWVWSEQEAAAIRSWTQGLDDSPEAIVGGNLLLETWREGTLSWVKADLDRVRELRARHRQTKHAVFTLQGFETEADLRELATVAAQTRDSFYWWFRLHPVNPAARGAMEAALRSARVENASVQANTDLPLYAVLRDADVHVTRYSASVIEAASFGVPSVLVSKKEISLFPQELERGWAIVAEGAGAIASAVAAQVAATPKLRAEARTARSVSPEAAIDRLLDLKRQISVSH